MVCTLHQNGASTLHQKGASMNGQRCTKTVQAPCTEKVQPLAPLGVQGKAQRPCTNTVQLPCTTVGATKKTNYKKTSYPITNCSLRSQFAMVVSTPGLLCVSGYPTRSGRQVTTRPRARKWKQGIP